MEIAVLQPIKIDQKEGPKTLDPGTVLTLPDDQAQTLLEADPPKVCNVSQEPLCVGMRVSYRYPTDIEGPTDYRWEPALGEIEEIDYGQHLALIIPAHEPRAWLWVSLVYVKALAS